MKPDKSSGGDKWSPRTRGVVPPPPGWRLRPRRGPRARGGGPNGGDWIGTVIRWSPRTRGWSLLARARPVRRVVVPAHAGVVPLHRHRRGHHPGGPRARGGGPPWPTPRPWWCRWSPRTRGWSRWRPNPTSRKAVVPAHAGVVLAPSMARSMPPGGPRARGGGPLRARRQPGSTGWSPRTRGWSRGRRGRYRGAVVVPAHAGVVPAYTASWQGTRSGPRARGVVLCDMHVTDPWTGGPRARGGGPNAVLHARRDSVWSPRTRGWSRWGRRRVRPQQSGPTMPAIPSHPLRWSPRTRGWSHARRRPVRVRRVVPAHAGVVPC